MPATAVGSVWSVPQLGDAAVVVLSGPFAAGTGAREYLVAPLYSDHHPGFVWTSEDVRVTAEETGLRDACYVALWNARPILEADLGLELGTLPIEVVELLKDFYWASINDKSVRKHDRLGTEVRSPDEPAAKFQARELERWEPLSGRVFMQAISAGTTFIWFDDAWTLNLDEIEQLRQEIEESESLLGTTNLEAVGQEWVRLTAPLEISYTGLPDMLDATLFDQSQAQGLGWRAGWTMRSDLDPNGAVDPEPTADHLSEAA